MCLQLRLEWFETRSCPHGHQTKQNWSGLAPGPIYWSSNNFTSWASTSAPSSWNQSTPFVTSVWSSMASCQCENTNQISSICFFHLRHQWKIRPLIDSNSAQRLMLAFILSRVDYCNTLLRGLPASTFCSNAMSAECRCPLCGWFIPMSAALWSRYTGYRSLIGYDSNCVLMHGMNNRTSPAYLSDTTTLISPVHGVSNRTSPAYLSDTTTSISSMPGHPQLCSAMTNEFDVPRTRTKFGDRGNNLPDDIRNSTNLSTFK